MEESEEEPGGKLGKDRIHSNGASSLSSVVSGKLEPASEAAVSDRERQNRWKSTET